MSKPVKTQAELIEMAKAELKVHADPPDGLCDEQGRRGHATGVRGAKRLRSLEEASGRACEYEETATAPQGDRGSS